MRVNLGIIEFVKVDINLSLYRVTFAGDAGLPVPIYTEARSRGGGGVGGGKGSRHPHPRVPLWDLISPLPPQKEENTFCLPPPPPHWRCWIRA